MSKGKRVISSRQLVSFNSKVKLTFQNTRIKMQWFKGRGVLTPLNGLFKLVISDTMQDVDLAVIELTIINSDGKVTYEIGRAEMVVDVTVGGVSLSELVREFIGE